jgi:hypothetical protein
MLHYSAVRPAKTPCFALFRETSDSSCCSALGEDGAAAGLGPSFKLLTAMSELELSYARFLE